MDDPLQASPEQSSPSPTTRHYDIDTPGKIKIPKPVVLDNHFAAPKFPRSVTWRIQLGLLKGDVGSSLSLDEIYQQNKETIAQQHKRFQELVEKHVEMEDEEEEQHVNFAEQGIVQKKQQERVVDDMDPLTAMVRENEERETRKQELYLKYRKERARRKRGLNVEAQEYGEESDGIDRASLSIIEKDLQRLPHPRETSTDPNSPSVATPNTQEQRISNLREILYIYAQENPHMGYRQGMHEVASYLMFVLELEEPEYTDNPLFTPILPFCFALLETVLGQLETAYDASGDQSLQNMSHAILSKLHQNDPALYHHLTTCPNIPPPPIYCTRWVRLLFSREVVGYENVLKLWDVFLEYPQIMRALEVTCASRILLLREFLMDPQYNPLDLLMNIPALTDITPLTTTVRRLMAQKDADEPIQLPPSQLLPTGSPYKPEQDHPLAEQPQGSTQKKNVFNFNKLKQTLNERSESLKKKFANTTNEWKQAQNEWNKQQQQQQREQQPNDNNMERGTSTVSASSDMMAASGQAIRNHSATGKPTEEVLFVDPLLNPQIMARNQIHSTWAQHMQSKIWTLQEFLMAVEQQGTMTNPEGGGSDNTSPGIQAAPVPREVWEALADLDRVQHEIQNYSMRR